MLILSPALETIIIAELTVRWEENMEWASKQRLLWYEQLAQDCKPKGRNGKVLAVEEGCREVFLMNQ